MANNNLNLLAGVADDQLNRIIAQQLNDRVPQLTDEYMARHHMILRGLTDQQLANEHLTHHRNVINLMNQGIVRYLTDNTKSVFDFATGAIGREIERRLDLRTIPKSEEPIRRRDDDDDDDLSVGGGRARQIGNIDNGTLITM